MYGYAIFLKTEINFIDHTVATPLAVTRFKKLY